MCIAKLSKVTQRNEETVDLFISHFKKMRNKCKIHLPETKYVKMAQRGLEIELRKKESYRRKKSVGNYCQEVNQDVAVVDLSATLTFTCPLLVEKTPNVWKKAQIVDTHVQYTVEVAKIEEIFDFLVKEKFITFPKDHQIPNKDELREKAYCKYHNSWNHTTNACWGFRNVIQDNINKEILKFPDKKKDYGNR